MANNSIGFRLAVWRPIRLERSVAVEANERDGCEWPLARQRLHEQVYQWQPHEDVWGGLTKASDAQELRKVLIEQFDPYQPPTERTIAKLEHAIAIARRIISEGNSQWSDCETPIEDQQSDELTFRANILASLCRHLEWVCAIFRNLPGTSVTIR